MTLHTRAIGSTLPLLAALLAAMLSSCLADEGHCSPHQELNGAGLCVCIRGYVPDGKLVCRACGEHEVSRADTCTCEDGYTRDADMQCVEQSTAIGVDCSSDDDCETDAPYCVVDDAAPYCTSQGCDATTDCSGGYACDDRQTPSVCLRGPSGLDDSCTSPDDCAGKDASYCQMTRGVCRVPDCASDADCFIGWECCDLTQFGMPRLCVREAACPVP